MLKQKNERNEVTTMAKEDSIVIVGMARTPMGSFMGGLSPLSASDLGKCAIEEALKRAGVKGDDVDEVLMGCVVQAGQGQNPARQAMRKAGIPDKTGAATINKVCGSGMKSVMIAKDSILSGSNNIVVAGGMESMTNAPYGLMKARSGYRMLHEKIIDLLFKDGLEEASTGGGMGSYGDATAVKYNVTREEMDTFAIESLARANRAIKDGDFKDEIIPVVIADKKGDITISEDECSKGAKPDKIPTLKPAFSKDGRVTAATSSSIADGAAALVLMRRSEAEKRGIKIIAEIKAQATHSQEPEWFTTAPVGAVKKVLEKAGWAKDEVDLYELNEAFAVVTMVAMKELGLPHEKVNVNGGACALGHPIGCSGARLIVTLISALQKLGKKKGVAALCIGGGEAVSVAIELA